MDEQQAIELLKKYAPDERVLKIILDHSQAVQKVALRICEHIDCDREFIKCACLLHDIGRFKCPPGKKGIRHGVVGAEILRKEGLDEKYAKVCERHLGAGISKQDIVEQNLDLPLQDFVPETKEEKIIAYADNLIFGTREGTLEEVKERFRKEIGEKCIEKIEKLHNQIESLEIE